jgi:hypothetical protein
MIAAGIVLFFLGVLAANLLGDPRPLKHNKWDYFAGVVILCGVASAAAGLTVLAWRYLP